MKKLFITCCGRTGSSFLADHFASMDFADYKDSNQYNCWEFFAMWPPNFWRNIHFLTDTIKQPLPDSFINFMSNTYRENYRKDSRFAVKRGESMKLDKFPYTLNMLKDFSNVLNQFGLTHFVHKHISAANHKGGWSFSDVLPLCDGVIVNYRKSILDTWISNIKSQESQSWVAQEYNEKYDEKIYWSKRQFVAHALKYKKSYEELFQALHRTKKPYTVLQYEDFCSQSNKYKFLKDKLSTIGFGDINLKPAKIVKQSKPREHYDECFKEYHIKEFRKDYHDIKELTTYEIPQR